MDRDLLHRVHIARLRAHGWNEAFVQQSPWPKTEAEWRQTPHGAPWDTNVMMAEWHVKFYSTMKEIMECSSASA